MYRYLLAAVNIVGRKLKWKHRANLSQLKHIADKVVPDNIAELHMYSIVCRSSGLCLP